MERSAFGLRAAGQSTDIRQKVCAPTVRNRTQGAQNGKTPQAQRTWGVFWVGLLTKEAWTSLDQPAFLNFRFSFRVPIMIPG